MPRMKAFAGPLLPACAVLLSLACAAHAADAPDNVQAEVKDAAKQCTDLGGKPNTEAMLKALDFTGKGGPDWIIDYAKLDCAGTTNPFCGTGGCSLSLYVYEGGSTWKQVLDETVRAYSVIKIKGKPALRLTMGGSACGKVNAASCRFVFQNGKMTPAR
jgi:hypothetical protein